MFLQFTCSTAWIGMVETIKIAILATFFGMILSLPMGLLSSRNLFPQYITYPSRAVVSACRSLPSLIWAIIFVIIVGLGPTAGILAMTIFTVGYLGKMQYEAIEGMNSAPLEAANAMGLTKAEVSFWVVIPETANHLIAQMIFMFEYNVRSGTVIGIVGAGGIGYYINLYLKFLQYEKVGAYLFIIFMVVMLFQVGKTANSGAVDKVDYATLENWISSGIEVKGHIEHPPPNASVMCTITGYRVEGGKKIPFSKKIDGFEIANKISKSLAKDACIMSVDGKLKDLSFSINKNAEVKICLLYTSDAADE